MLSSRNDIQIFGMISYVVTAAFLGSVENFRMYEIISDESITRFYEQILRKLQGSTHVNQQFTRINFVSFDFTSFLAVSVMRAALDEAVSLSTVLND